MDWADCLNKVGSTGGYALVNGERVKPDGGRNGYRTKPLSGMA
ncbi:hypothetical protein SD78_3521 [Bacillus badius]|nr:hypothetical protein SD78_3521 [Bacillus badius]